MQHIKTFLWHKRNPFRGCSVHADEEDAKTILQQLSIKRFIAATCRTPSGHLFAGNALTNTLMASSLVPLGQGQSGSGPMDTLYCLQLIRPENQRHLAVNVTETTDENVVIVCFNEIRMGVLAKAIMFPGERGPTFVCPRLSIHVV